MEKGYWARGTRAKEGAYDTIDNVSKFSLYEEDYEDFEEWVAYTTEEYIEGRINELKQLLADTDYIAAKAMDALICCSNVAELLAAMATLADEYRDKIKERQAWRKEINELEAGEEV
jgi:hypothetical protein